MATARGDRGTRCSRPAFIQFHLSRTRVKKSPLFVAKRLCGLGQEKRTRPQLATFAPALFLPFFLAYFLACSLENDSAETFSR
jgi:hypothetical protein